MQNRYHTFSLPPPEFSFSEDHSHEPPHLPCQLSSSSELFQLSEPGCQAAPGTLTLTPNRLSFPSLYCLPSSGHRAHGPPLQFCPSQDTLDLDPPVPIHGALMPPSWSLAHCTYYGFCKFACLWSEFHSHPDKDHGFLPKSTGVQRPLGWGPRPPC